MSAIFASLLLLPMLLQSSPEVFTGVAIDHPGRIRLLYPVPFDSSKTQGFVMGDKLINVEPGVIPPSLASAFLLENTQIKAGETVLDMGCGNGVQAVFAALNGAGKVVASDISTAAAINTRHNAELHNVQHIVDARAGDLFAVLKPGEQFDVVIFNAGYPGFVGDPRGKNLHERFYSELDRWLKPNGRIYYHVGYINRVPEIAALLKKHGFRIMRMNMVNALNYDREPVIYTVQRIKDTEPPHKLTQGQN